MSELGLQHGHLQAVRRRARVVFALTAYLALMAAGYVVLEPGSWALHFWANLFWTLSALLAGLKCLHTARRCEAAHRRRAWRWFGIGCLFWFGGMLIWDWRELVQQIYTPFPDYSDIGFDLLVPCFIAGFFHYGARTRSQEMTLLKFGDLGVVLCVLIIASVAVLHDPIENMQVGTLYLLAALAYPILHVSALVFGLIVFWRHQWGAERTPLAILLVGFAVLTATILVYTNTLLNRTFEAGRWIDLFWNLNFCLFFWAAEEEELLAFASSGESEEETPGPGAFEAFVPAVSVLVLLWAVFAFPWNLDERWGTLMIFVSFVLAGFLAVREWSRQRVQAKSAEERRLLERELFEAQRLESLGLMAGSVAHDFNNLLFSIKGYSMLVADQLEPGTRAHDALENVRAATDRAGELVGQLLAYAGRDSHEARFVDLNELIEETLEIVRPKLSPDAQVVVELDTGLPRVMVDPVQMGQVLMNLMLNASDALIDGRGRIEIRTGITREGGREQLLLEVSDSGRGMSAETRSRIFEPFYSTKTAGRGLGLAAVQGIIRRHDGELRTHSQLGRGSSFIVLLPKPAPRAA